MTKKVLCAVDDTEHSKIAVAVAGELAKATGAELTLLAVNVPMGSPGRGGIAYAWEDSDLKRVLDSATAIAKKAGVSDPKTAGAEKPRCGTSPSSYMPRTTISTTLWSERVAKAGWRGWCWVRFQETLSLVPIAP